MEENSLQRTRMFSWYLTKKGFGPQEGELTEPSLSKGGGGQPSLTRVKSEVC